MYGDTSRNDNRRLELDTSLGLYPSDGIDGVLSELGALVIEGMTNEHIRAHALRLTEGVTPIPATGLPDRTRFIEMADVIYRWMAENIAYVHDPAGIENLTNAKYTKKLAVGDCDAHTVLGMSLLSSVGITTRFVLVGQDPNYPEAFTHIYLEFRGEDGQWYGFDTTLATHAGDAVPPELVIKDRVVTLEEALGETSATGPLRLQTRRASYAVEEGAGARLSGLGAPQLGAQTKGPVQGPKAWLQIEGVSHSGRPPAGENYAIDVYVEREYELFGTCQGEVVIRDVDADGEIIANVVHLSKWSGIATCEGRGRLTFPLGFDPTSTLVQIEVYNTRFGSRSGLLGQSQPLYLASQNPEERKRWVDDVVSGVDLEWMIPVAYAGAGAAVLFAAWPYVAPITRRWAAED